MACHLIGDRARIRVTSRSISGVVFKLREMSVAKECQMQLYHKELNLLLNAEPYSVRKSNNGMTSLILED